MAYVRTRLGRLFIEERGATKSPGDPAIVLLHGLLFDGGMWKGQLEPLAALGRVVVFDGPGHGKSEPAPRFVLEEHADAMFDALGELGIRRAVFVGLSWGGMTAMRVALQHPEKVAGIAVLDSNAESEPLGERLRFRALIALHRRLGIPPAIYRREIAPLLFGPRALREQPELVEASYRRAMGWNRGGLSRAAIAVVIHRKNILPDLGKVRTPTLVLCGAEDAATKPAASAKIAQAIPEAEHVVIDDVGHMSALEDPARVNAHVVPFVTRALATRR